MEKLEINKHPMYKVKSMLESNGWKLISDTGWLDAPFYRNVDIFKKDGIESSLIVSYRKKGQYLNTKFGKHGNFKDLNESSLSRFEKDFK